MEQKCAWRRCSNKFEVLPELLGTKRAKKYCCPLHGQYAWRERKNTVSKGLGALVLESPIPNNLEQFKPKEGVELVLADTKLETKPKKFDVTRDFLKK